MQITIQLDQESRRPIANLNWFQGCRALIDTGALFPIWNGDGKSLENGFNARLWQKGIEFWRLRRKSKRRFIQDSATMFDGMTYEIDTIHKRFNIDTKDNQPVRILKISKDTDNKISVYLAETYTTPDEYDKNIKKL